MTKPTSDLLSAAEAARQRGDHPQAEALYRQVAASPQRNPAVLYNIGTYCATRSELSEARHWFEQACSEAPDFGLAWYNTGCCARRQGDLSSARQALQQALQIDPAHHDARVNLSLVEFALGDAEAALRLAYLALEAHPDDPDVFANLATYLRTLGATEDALLCAESASRLAPEHAGAWLIKGTLAQDQRQLATAATCYRHALESEPDNAPAHWNLALVELTLGHFTTGWREYDWRMQLPQMRGHYPDLGIPLWQGEALRDKTLLLVAEQGHGDTLQFIRLAQPLHAAGAQLKLMAQPALLRLLRELPWFAEVVSQNDPPPAADYRLPLLSLPHRLNLQLTDLPGPTPYLQVPTANLAAWRQRLANTGRPRIGLAWSGDPRRHDPENHRVDARRSLPLQQLAPLFTSRPQCDWYSLQKGEPAAQAAAWPQLIDHSQEWQDFADTAAFIMQLDQVITVDTAIAHLSAALGKPTWVLSRFDACWRWLDGRDDSPWYPSLRLFRQQRPGDWEPALQTIANQLDKEIIGI